MLEALARLQVDAEEAFGATNPGRVEQLTHALGTAAMAVDYLFIEIPYTLS